MSVAIDWELTYSDMPDDPEAFSARCPASCEHFALEWAQGVLMEAAQDVAPIGGMVTARLRAADDTWAVRLSVPRLVHVRARLQGGGYRIVERAAWLTWRSTALGDEEPTDRDYVGCPETDHARVLDWAREELEWVCRDLTATGGAVLARLFLGESRATTIWTSSIDVDPGAWFAAPRLNWSIVESGQTEAN